MINAEQEGIAAINIEPLAEVQVVSQPRRWREFSPVPILTTVPQRDDNIVHSLEQVNKQGNRILVVNPSILPVLSEKVVEAARDLLDLLQKPATLITLQACRLGRRVTW